MFKSKKRTRWPQKTGVEIEETLEDQKTLTIALSEDSTNIGYWLFKKT